jgi:hypothetical protein
LDQSVAVARYCSQEVKNAVTMRFLRPDSQAASDFSLMKRESARKYREFKDANENIERLTRGPMWTFV